MMSSSGADEKGKHIPVKAMVAEDVEESKATNLEDIQV
jgi:hypothetical protein